MVAGVIKILGRKLLMKSTTWAGVSSTPIILPVPDIRKVMPIRMLAARLIIFLVFSLDLRILPDAVFAFLAVRFAILSP